MSRLVRFRTRIRATRMAALSFALLLSLLSFMLVVADNTTVDGDGVAPFAESSLSFGTVCSNTAALDSVLVAIKRTGAAGSTNVFKDSSTVNLSVLSTTGTGLSAAFNSGSSISLPSNWGSLANNTLSSSLTSDVTLNTGAAGAFSGSITYRASGVNASNTSINRDGVVSVTATVQDCNTAPTTPGAPSLTVGDNPNNSGVFTLGWTASTDAESNPITYLLQHKDANDAAYSTVASGLAANSYAFTSGSPEAEGTWTYRVQASDGSLSSAFSSDSSAIKVDKSNPNAPSVSADRAPDYAGGGGWYKDTVTVSFSANGDPNLLDGSAGSGVDPASVPAASVLNTSGSHNVSGTVDDYAGNTSASAGLTVQVDATKPSVAFTDCPTSPLLLGASASASWTASDAHSGLATAAGGSVALNTSTVGPKTANAPTATDNVGHNSDTVTCAYSVIYDFGGFYSPVDNTPVFNVVKAGSAIPIKFSLGGDQGLNVIASGFPKSYAMNCTTGAPEDVAEETVTAGSSSLSYDATTGRYIYVWKTEKSWGGTCRRFVLQLNDGTVHEAYFKFSR